jgi:hypothetical protein
MPKLKVLVQVGHEAPREGPLGGKLDKQTGAAGEVEVGRKLATALMARLQADPRFEPRLIPGGIPDDVKAGRWHAHAFVSLHCDGNSNATIEGYSFGYPPGFGINKRLADLIAAEFAPFHRSQRRSDNYTTAQSKYYGWKHVPTTGPEVLVEHGFVSNPTERAWLHEHVDQLADAEYRALLKFFGLAEAPERETAAVDAEHATTWAWFPEWALWVLGRGKYQVHGPRNAAVRPKLAPPKIPKLAWVVLRQLQQAEEEHAPAVPSELAEPAEPGQPAQPDADEIGPATTLLALARVDHASAERYLLKRPHGDRPDGDMRELARLYFDLAQPAGLDPLVAIAQMVVETGNMTSAWSRPPRRNLAGIGVTGKPGEGLSFETWTAAVEAHIGRLVAYAVAAGGETPPQKALVEKALARRPLRSDFRGAAPTLEGLALRWAQDAAYATKIARVANEIRAGG